MGPRSIDRGTDGGRAAGDRGDGASMGPRSIDRGTHSGLDILTLSLTALQWGRDQLIAELSHRSPQAFARTKLQWGRDQLIAELRAAVLGPPMSPWLQWGRDQLIAELSRTGIVIPPPCRASMGPRSIDRGTCGADV